MGTPPATAILLIGSSGPDAEFLHEMCVQSGWDPAFTVVRDGATAMSLLADRTASAARPHLILLDLDALGAYGHDLLADLRARTGLAGVPVVVLSDIADPDQRGRSLSLGAVSHELKPVDVAEADRLMRQLAAYVAA